MQTNSPLRDLISESRKIRESRGGDFFNDKKTEKIETSKIQIKPENFDKIRSSHLHLNRLLADYDKKIFDHNQVTNQPQARSQYVQLYVNEKLIKFLKDEAQKKETKWKLRKNAGLGSLIQNFIESFSEMQSRQKKQKEKIEKIILDFRKHLVIFKKQSLLPEDYIFVEESNIMLKKLTNELITLIINLEFDDNFLKREFSADSYKWIDFIVEYKKYI